MLPPTGYRARKRRRYERAAVIPRATPDLLARLNRLNLTSVFLGTAMLVLAGLILPGVVGGVLLLLLAAALATFIALTWQGQLARVRVIRVVMLTLLIMLIAVKLF
jgi:hypothetical protein